MSKKKAGDETVRAFIGAVYPDAPDLAIAAFDEEHCLKVATAELHNNRAVIRVLRRKLAAALGKQK